MANNVELEKRMDTLEIQVEVFNKTNKNLRRFRIFNTFTFTFDRIDNERAAINIMNEEGGAFENTMTLLAESDENFIVANLADEKEYGWIVKTVDRLTKRTEELIGKARELAKPQVGILVYDEFSDSYILNSTTGAVLLKSKAIIKQISSTKIDLTNVLFNLRRGLTKQEFGNEIMGATIEEVIDACDKTAKKISDYSNQLANVERVPRVIVNISKTEENYVIESHITDFFGEFDAKGKTINHYKKAFDINKIDSMEEAYNTLRTYEILDENMKELAKTLISRTEPKLFNQSEKQWVLTKEGRNVIEDLKIINFMDEDLSSLEISIE